jgi:hypothetical protein
MDEDLASGADPMLMICALPPPPLKQAKKEFRHALMLCNALVTDVYQMMRTCEGIEVWTGSRAEENCPFTEACKLGGSVKQKKLSFDGEQTEEGNSDEELEKELAQFQNDSMDDKGGLRQRGSQATTNIGSKKTDSKKMPTSFGDSDDFNYKVADLSTDEEDED